MLEAAIRQTQILQYQVGGMVAFVEAENKEKIAFFFMKIMVLNDLLLFLLLGQSIVGCLLSCKNGGNLWQIIKQRNKKYKELTDNF